MFSRHELVWLTGQGWQGALDAAAPAQREAIEQWRRADWPAIVRRSEPGAGPDTLCLGIAPAPHPETGKQRIALQAHKAHVARTAAPMPLRELLPAAPARWRPALAAPGLRAYGSLAMQAITGLPYLGAASDIDLLFYPAAARELRSGLAALEAH